LIHRVEALFLDPDHVRIDTEDSMAPKGSITAAKGPIQAEAADCFLQIAVFEPGRALLQQDPTAMRALRALADPSTDAALTAEARMSAVGALVAIEGLSREPEPKGEEKKPEGHVFVSYQWVRARQRFSSLLPAYSSPAMIDRQALLNVVHIVSDLSRTGFPSNHREDRPVFAETRLLGLVRCAASDAACSCNAADHSTPDHLASGIPLLSSPGVCS
jgi:hypothetical protein